MWYLTTILKLWKAIVIFKYKSVKIFSPLLTLIVKIENQIYIIKRRFLSRLQRSEEMLQIFQSWQAFIFQISRVNICCFYAQLVINPVFVTSWVKTQNICVNPYSTLKLIPAIRRAEKYIICMFIFSSQLNNGVVQKKIFFSLWILKCGSHFLYSTAMRKTMIFYFSGEDFVYFFFVCSFI